MSDLQTPSEPQSGQAVQPAVQVPPAGPAPVDREAARRAQRNRNLMLALSLVAFIVIVYLVTVLRMGGHVAQRPL